MALFGRSGGPAAPGVGDEAAFEAALRKDLPRGQKGREDSLPRTLWAEPDALGAAWSYPHEKPGLLLGYRKGRELGWADDRHVLTVAGTRAGKGLSLIIPNLLMFPGSVLCIDPKGELSRITARRRGELGRCVVLDPFNENGRHASGNYNPLDDLDRDSVEVIDQAGAVADALILYTERDKHWTDAARALVRALILLVLDLDEKDRNLITLRELLMLTHKTVRDSMGAVNAVQGLKQEEGLSVGVREPVKDEDGKRSATLARMMMAMGDKYERVIAGAGEALMDMAPKERQSVLSEARTQTQFLDSPALRRVLTGKSDFRLTDLTREVVSVFLCLPARHMDTHDRWLRVVVNLAIGAFEPRREKAAHQVPVLMLLEEFPVLKRMEKIEAAAGQLAGSGVKLWFVVQNLGQLKMHYEKGWETFIANAGVITAFGNADVETLEYLAKKLGKIGMTVMKGTGKSSSELLKGGRLEQEELKDAHLLEIHELSEIFAREKMRVLVLAAGQPPLILERAVFSRDARFKGMFDT